MKLVLSGVVFAALSGAPLAADCAFCHAEVRFDEPMAQCFEDYVRAQDSAVSGEISIVNLGGCREDITLRGGLPTGPGADLVDASFVIPTQSLRCLASSVAERTRPMNSVTAFPVTTDCD